MKSGLLIFTLAAALFPTPSDARDCTQDDRLQMKGTFSSLQRDPDHVKCKEEAQEALGIIEDDLDSLLKNKEEYCKLESCKKFESLFVQSFENLPSCIITWESEYYDEFYNFYAFKRLEQYIKQYDFCDRHFLDKVKDVLDEKDYDEKMKMEKQRKKLTEERLKEEDLTKEQEQLGKEKTFNCSICYSDVCSHREIALCSGCKKSNGVYHKACIQEWFEISPQFKVKEVPTCPTCNEKDSFTYH